MMYWLMWDVLIMPMFLYFLAGCVGGQHRSHYHMDETIFGNYVIR